MTNDSKKEVIVRFAPSPTGYLHIGGARTALFNWLYAKHMGGKMLLRIEDTDRKRSTDEATKALIEGLTWLGLDWDGDPISQFENKERHKEVAYQLLEQGKAYKCYTTSEELSQFREENPYAKYQSPWRDYEGETPDRDYSIRIKAAQGKGEISIDDSVQGAIKVPFKELDDFIILRSDDTPTYLLAVVVDDFDMNITHVIRGDDHLTNTFRQCLIFDAMGWARPKFAHVPLIHGSDGAKLSKRHGSLGVHEYADMGYTPEALANYLLKLGWSHGDDEIIPMDKAIEWFDLDGINKAPARLNAKKLDALNAHYLKDYDDNKLLNLVLNQYDKEIPSSQKEWVLKALPNLKQRIKKTTELFDLIYVFIRDSKKYKDDAALSEIKDNKGTLEKLNRHLKDHGDWSEDALDTYLRDFANASFDGKLAMVMKPLRAVLVDRMNSPSLPMVMTILGKDEVLKRFETALAL